MPRIVGEWRWVFTVDSERDGSRSLPSFFYIWVFEITIPNDPSSETEPLSVRYHDPEFYFIREFLYLYRLS